MKEIDWDHLPPSTATQVSVSVRDFTNREAATELGNVVGQCVMELGSFMDLATLDGVTIAIDYDAALAGIDQGMEGLRRLDRTDTEELQGFAKTCQVLRDGSVKSHIIFNAAMLVPLIAGDAATAEDREMAIGFIAHECAHVEVDARMAEVVPESRLGASSSDFERAVLFQIAEIAWSEYAVCRLSARFAPRQNQQHAESVAAVMPGARARANEAIRSYRTHGDLRRLLAEAGSELCQPIKAVAYLLGGMDAEGLGWTDFPEARSVIEKAGYADLVDRLHECCEALWETRSEWSTDKDVLGSLTELTRDVLASGGIHLRRGEDGDCHINVPFTPDTMP